MFEMNGIQMKEIVKGELKLLFVVALWGVFADMSTKYASKIRRADNIDIPKITQYVT